ncbi:MAG TPA: RbsD/FucU domain-containing protein [Tabrizicola sp.]|nr:RbsD/FucU domain-containing protein [Tabrizicola sp.]
MLKGIDNRLNAGVLGTLRAMGHGDTVIVVDTNFPAEAISRSTVVGRLLQMENLTAAEAVSAILSVMPLDTFVADFAGRMEVVGIMRSALRSGAGRSQAGRAWAGAPGRRVRRS